MNKLEKQVLQLIGEDPDSPDVFTDDDVGMDQIRTSVSEGIQEVLTLTGGFIQTFRLPLVTDQTFYTLDLVDGDVGWFTDVWHVENQDRLTQASLIQLDSWDPRWMRYTGTPTQYVPIGHSTVAICPKASSSAGTLALHVAVVPRRYQYDTDRILLKRTYERAVVNYAVAEYFASRGDANEAALNLQLYAQVLGINKNDMGERGQVRSFDSWKQKDNAFRLSTS